MDIKTLEDKVLDMLAAKEKTHDIVNMVRRESPMSGLKGAFDFVVRIKNIVTPAQE